MRNVVPGGEVTCFQHAYLPVPRARDVTLVRGAFQLWTRPRGSASARYSPEIATVTGSRDRPFSVSSCLNQQIHGTSISFLEEIDTHNL